MTRKLHQDWLFQLTALPTASGREERVIAWVKRWAKARRQIELRADRFGNLILRRRAVDSPRPIFFTAHLDHPAFVVSHASGPKRLSAEFRGGVSDSYFLGSPVLWHPRKGPPVTGKVRSLEAGKDGDFKRVEVELKAPVAARAGDVLTWGVGPQRVKNGRLFASACDDLAGVAAALAALDLLLRRPNFRGDVRLLLTRAEEVGFVGAIAACKARTMPRGALVVALENSKSFPESPIGAGPIVRVGDRTSTFDPDLTYRIGKIAEHLAATEKGFQWQRKLMPGGTCEASAFQSYGYAATCLCLPLGNYHNMNEATGRIDAETISLTDYHSLIRLLVAVGERLHDPNRSPSLKSRLDDLFASRKKLL